jgi:hypothetical protein
MSTTPQQPRGDANSQVSRRLALRTGLLAGAGLAGLATGALSSPRTAAAGWTVIQYSWAWCSDCKSMFYEANGTLGRCAAGGEHYRPFSLFYWHWYWTGSGIVEDVDGFQQNWRWCSKCQGMSYAGFGSGVCPAGGGHNHSISLNYGLFHNGASNSVYQWGWRWCTKCQALFFGLQQAESVCPVSDTHDAGGISYTYSVGINGWG